MQNRLEYSAFNIYSITNRSSDLQDILQLMPVEIYNAVLIHISCAMKSGSTYDLLTLFSVLQAKQGLRRNLLLQPEFIAKDEYALALLT